MEDIWHCCEPELSRHVTVIDSTDHMTREACIRSYIPQIDCSKMKFPEFTNEEVLANVICFRQTEGLSCCDLRFTAINRSDVQSALSSVDCANIEDFIRKQLVEEFKATLFASIENRLSKMQVQYDLDSDLFKKDDELYSEACIEEHRFAVSIGTLNRWHMKKQISESDLEGAKTDMNYFLRKVGGLNQEEEIRETSELFARMISFFWDLARKYNCRTELTQNAAYSAFRFRRDRLDDERKFWSLLRDSNEMQLEVISRRPVYKEDILILALQQSEIRRGILSATSNASQIHLVIFSTDEARRACLEKLDAAAQDLARWLNPNHDRALRVKVWYFPGRFRPQDSGAGSESAGVAPPLSFLPRHAWADFAPGLEPSTPAPPPAKGDTDLQHPARLGLVPGLRGPGTSSGSTPCSDCLLLGRYHQDIDSEDWSGLEVADPAAEEPR